MIDNQFDLKITLKILNPENQSGILMKIRKMLLFSKSFSVLLLFSIGNQCYPNKEKTYKLLFIAVIFPVIDPSEHIDTI